MKTIVYLILLFLQVVRHNNVEQLLLHGRMLQASEATTKFPCRFSCHSATTGSFFTLMLLGLKLCSCQFQGNLHKFKLGLQLLEDRIQRYLILYFLLFSLLICPLQLISILYFPTAAGLHQAGSAINLSGLRQIMGILHTVKLNLFILLSNFC